MQTHFLHIIVASVAMSLLICSCQRTKPQQPSNRTEQTDTVSMAMMRLNQQLATAADHTVTEYVKRSPEHYALHEFGFWYRLLRKNEQADNYILHEPIRLHIEVYSLDGDKLADIIEDTKVGASADMLCQREALRTMRRGEKIEIIAPWYTAYGARGNDAIEPYTNVRITIDTVIDF